MSVLAGVAGLTRAMSDVLQIRSARPADAARLVELLVGGAVPEPAVGPSSTGSTSRGENPTDLTPYEHALREIAATDGTDMVVAERDGIVVGMYQLITFRHLQGRGGRCAEIESVHVDSTQRSGGIGRALIADAIDRARAAGCYRIQLTSNKLRPDAHRFYLANGFTASHEGFKLDLDR
jgi:GNAT superfamily N-acetyltransferase